MDLRTLSDRRALDPQEARRISTVQGTGQVGPGAVRCAGGWGGEVAGVAVCFVCEPGSVGREFLTEPGCRGGRPRPTSEIALYLKAFEQLRSMAVYGADARSLIVKAIDALR